MHGPSIIYLHAEKIDTLAGDLQICVGIVRIYCLPFDFTKFLAQSHPISFKPLTAHFSSSTYSTRLSLVAGSQDVSISARHERSACFAVQSRYILGTSSSFGRFVGSKVSGSDETAKRSLTPMLDLMLWQQMLTAEQNTVRVQ